MRHRLIQLHDEPESLRRLLLHARDHARLGDAVVGRVHLDAAELACVVRRGSRRSSFRAGRTARPSPRTSSPTCRRSSEGAALMRRRPRRPAHPAGPAPRVTPHGALDLRGRALARQRRVHRLAHRAERHVPERAPVRERARGHDRGLAELVAHPVERRLQRARALVAGEQLGLLALAALCRARSRSRPAAAAARPASSRATAHRATSKIATWSSTPTGSARWRVMVRKRWSRSLSVTVRPVKPSPRSRRATWSESRSSVPSRNSASRQSSGSVTSCPMDLGSTPSW